MATTIPAATQHDFMKLPSLIGGMFSSLCNSIVFARMCEAEWAAEGRIDAAALNRISELSNLD